jgi:16S rRNA processing protein RimM
VVSSTGEYSIFDKLTEVKTAGGETEETLKIERRVSLKNRIALKFAGFDSPDKATQLIGRELEVEERELPTLREDQFYCYKLIGLKVVDTDGEAVGEIVDILENLANDVLIVRSPEQEEVLIPAVKEVVKRIDLKRGLVEIKLIPGLLE